MISLVDTPMLWRWSLPLYNPRYLLNFIISTKSRNSQASNQSVRPDIRTSKSLTRSYRIGEQSAITYSSIWQTNYHYAFVEKQPFPLCHFWHFCTRTFLSTLIAFLFLIWQAFAKRRIDALLVLAFQAFRAYPVILLLLLINKYSKLCAFSWLFLWLRKCWQLDLHK